MVDASSPGSRPEMSARRGNSRAALPVEADFSSEKQEGANCCVATLCNIRCDYDAR